MVILRLALSHRVKSHRSIQRLATGWAERVHLCLRRQTHHKNTFWRSSQEVSRGQFFRFPSNRQRLLRIQYSTNCHKLTFQTPKICQLIAVPVNLSRPFIVSESFSDFFLLKGGNYCNCHLASKAWKVSRKGLRLLWNFSRWNCLKPFFWV